MKKASVMAAAWLTVSAAMAQPAGRALDQLRSMAHPLGGQEFGRLPSFRTMDILSPSRHVPPTGDLNAPLLLAPSNDQTGSGVVNIPCLLGQQQGTCQLDSGAAESLLQDSPASESYQVVGHGQISGASGKPESVAEVEVPDVKVGGIDFGAQVMARVPDGFGDKHDEPALIGINILSNLDSVRFDFDRNQLLGDVAISGPSYKLYRSDEGHLILPLELNGSKGMGLWDTGASVTVVDPGFIEAHGQDFKLLGHAQVRDIAGKIIQAGLYLARSIKIGDFDFQDVVVVGVPAPDFFSGFAARGLAPVIVGYNLITRASWTMDFKNGRWSVTQPKAGDSFSVRWGDGQGKFSVASLGTPIRLPESIRIRLPGRMRIR